MVKNRREIEITMDLLQRAINPISEGMLVRRSGLTYSLFKKYAGLLIEECCMEKYQNHNYIKLLEKRGEKINPINLPPKDEKLGNFSGRTKWVYKTSEDGLSLLKILIDATRD